jgi:hypothetical protein
MPAVVYLTMSSGSDSISSLASAALGGVRPGDIHRLTQALEEASQTGDRLYQLGGSTLHRHRGRPRNPLAPVPGHITPRNPHFCDSPAPSPLSLARGIICQYVPAALGTELAARPPWPTGTPAAGSCVVGAADTSPGGSGK